jgi:hypothetical protein
MEDERSSATVFYRAAPSRAVETGLPTRPEPTTFAGRRATTGKVSLTVVVASGKCGNSLGSRSDKTSGRSGACHSHPTVSDARTGIDTGTMTGKGLLWGVHALRQASQSVHGARKPRRTRFRRRVTSVNGENAPERISSDDAATIGMCTTASAPGCYGHCWRSGPAAALPASRVGPGSPQAGATALAVTPNLPRAAAPSWRISSRGFKSRLSDPT